MKVILNNQEYFVQTEHNALVYSIEKLLPLTLKLSRSADHEYYASLPEEISIDGAKSTSFVKTGWIYYFKDWNAFSINFKDKNITPYKVYVVGKVIGGIECMLEKEKAMVTVELKR